MYKYLLCLLLAVNVSHTVAQQGNFRRPLTTADFAFLKKEAAECFGFNGHMQLSYSNRDFVQGKKKTGDKPATLENIELLKKRIDKTPNDAALYTEITGMYSRLNMPDEAIEYRAKSFSVISNVLKQHPDSADAILTLGGIYMSALQVDSAMAKYKLALTKDPGNREAVLLLPFMHIMNGKFDSAYAFIIKQIEKHPDNYTVYEALPVYYIYKFYNQLGKLNELKTIEPEKLEPEAMINLKLLSDYYERDKNDFKREYLYRVTYQVCYSTLITYKTINDSTFDYKNVKFITSPKDEATLKTAETFFTKCLHTKDLKNKFLPNKILGNINLLLNRPKEAIPYLKKAIKLKPVKECTVGDNTSEDYDNLITAYFILKDTAHYEKIILEKIKIKPAIEPAASDYIMAGKVSIDRKKFTEAETYFKKAMELDTKNADIYLGLALTYYLNNNYTAALNSIDEAYKINPKKWELYILYGIVSLCNNDPVNAFEAFKSGKKLHNSKWIRVELMEKYYDIF